MVDLLEDNELERLDNEDRKFGRIEAPPLRPREKQGPSGRTKKLKRKAVFYSTEIEHMDDNLLKTIMAQYMVVMVDPNHQTRDDRLELPSDHLKTPTSHHVFQLTQYVSDQAARSILYSKDLQVEQYQTLKGLRQSVRTLPYRSLPPRIRALFQSKQIFHQQIYKACHQLC